MAYETLLYDVTGGLARITINRPDKLNALNGTVISELGRAAVAVASDPAVHAVILTGAGPKAFVAGADISELTSQGPMDGKARARAGQMVFRSFERLNKPVIAAINGFARGGGCELAMACHVRIASDTAKFGQPEVKLGLLPGYGGTVRLPRIVGKGRALELLLTGAIIDAAEALRIGLVSRVVPADALLAEAADREAGKPHKNSRFGEGVAGLSVAFKGGLPLLEKGAGTLAHVIGGGEQSEEVGLQEEGVLLAHLIARIHRLEYRPHGERALFHDAPRERLGFVQQPVGRHDTAHQTDAERLRRIDDGAREQELERPALADDPGQSHGAAVAR